MITLCKYKYEEITFNSSKSNVEKKPEKIASLFIIMINHARSS